MRTCPLPASSVLLPGMCVHEHILQLSLNAAGALPRPTYMAVPPPSYNGGVAAGPTTMAVPVGFEAGPEFNLPGRLRGPGALAPPAVSGLCKLATITPCPSAC